MFNVKMCAEMIKDCRNINEEYDFDTLVSKHTGDYSRNTFMYWFRELWKHIPKEFLYQTYKDRLCSDKGGCWYDMFFKSEIVEEIHKVSKHDTAENSYLSSLLDENGYLTIYHGHCKPTMRGSHSWTLNKDIAIWFGARNALFNGSPDFYCVTGKVRLNDVIAYIPEGGEEEIVVLQRNVKSKSKEFHKASDVDLDALRRSFGWDGYKGEG